MNNKKANINSRVTFGIILIVIGLLFLLDNLGLLFFELPYFTFHWEYILIGLGIFFLTTDRNKTTGTILIAIGLFSLLPSFWPLLLVALGVYILLNKEHHHSNASHKDSDTETEHTDFIDDVSIFSGNKKTYTSTNFRGGKITAIFGGGEINFSNCFLAEGKNFLDILTIFGGYEIRVPDDWKIYNDVVSIFGGVSDERHKDPNRVYDESKVLILKGLALFGGVEIKS